MERAQLAAEAGVLPKIAGQTAEAAAELLSFASKSLDVTSASVKAAAVKSEEAVGTAGTCSCSSMF